MDSAHIANQHGAAESLLAEVLAVRQSVAAMVQPVKAYLLVEQGLDGRLPELVRRHLPESPISYLFEGTPEQHLGPLSPWLIELPPTVQPKDLRPFCLASQTLSAVSWLWSPLALVPLSKHLRHYMGGVLWDETRAEEEGGIAIRISDPRVLPSVMDVLTASQRESLLRPLMGWGTWTRYREWRIWQGAMQPPEDRPEPLRLNRLQLAKLIQLGQPDKLLSCLDDEYGHDDAPGNTVKKQLLDLPPDMRYRAVSELLAKAREFSYHSDQDCMLFVSLAYLIHPHFFSFPGFAQALRHGRLAEETLADTLAQLPETTVQEVADDLARQMAEPERREHIALSSTQPA